MKRSNLLFMVFDFIVVLWLVFEKNQEVSTLVFTVGLLVNDVFAMHVVKYGSGRISKLVSDMFRYFFMTTFNLSFLFIFVMLLMRVSYYVNMPASWLKVVGGFSTIVMLYYFPAYLSVGRYRMYLVYGRKNLFESAREALKASIKFSMRKEYLPFVVIFYGGFGVLGKVSSVVPSFLGDALLVSFIYFVYAVFPVMAEKMMRR